MKITFEEFTKVFAMAVSAQSKHKSLRQGQAFFNALHVLHPKVANSIRGTHNDPFYLDTKINECIIQILDYHEKTKA